MNARNEEEEDTQSGSDIRRAITGIETMMSQGRDVSDWDEANQAAEAARLKKSVEKARAAANYICLIRHSQVIIFL